MRGTLLALVVLISACSSGAAVAPSAWFDAWAADFSAGDHVAMARFYDPLVDVHHATPDHESTQVAVYVNSSTSGKGRAWLAGWFANATRAEERNVGPVTVDGTTVLVPVTTPSLRAAALFVMEVPEGRITEQVTLRWRYSHKPGGAPDARLGWLDDLVRAHVGDRAIATIETGDRTGSAVFVEAGPNPPVVAVLLEPTGDCTSPDALLLSLDGESIRGVRRFSSGDRCPGTLGNGLRDLTIPGNVEDTPTASILVGSQSVTLYNSTPELERFVADALGRFEEAGLEGPDLGRITFAPALACDRRAGLTTRTGTSFDVVVCTDAIASCVPSHEACERFSPTAERGLLHELAHAWIEGRVDESQRSLVLAAAGLTEWTGADQPWHRRGSEFAAETLTWGLLAHPSDPVRLGSPPCETLTTVYETLTGRPSPHRCG
jgi:hypothetical protein